MIILREKVTRDELKKMSEKMYNRLVKAVVDIDQQSMIIDMEMHADGELNMLEEGSAQENLWGINLHPEMEGDEFVEFDSIINIRPSQGNRGRGIDNKDIQKKIRQIVEQWVIK